MKTVWALEDGSYSDYHVVGVYSTKEFAERASKFVGGNVSEWTLDPGVEQLNKGYSKWDVIMLRDGAVEGITRQNTIYDFDASHFLWERTKAPAYIGKGIPDALNATVWARDEKHAVKIVNEIRTQMIAESKWE